MSKTTIDKSQIVSIKGAWVTYTTDGGKKVKARKGTLTITEALPIERRRIGDITYNCSHYQRVQSVNQNYSLDNGDDLAHKLRGKPLTAAYKTAAKVLGVSQAELVAKYKHLNAGMQRMNLGNRIRAAMAE